MDLPFAHPHATLQPCIRTHEAGGGALGHGAVSRFRQRAVGETQGPNWLEDLGAHGVHMSKFLLLPLALESMTTFSHLTLPTCIWDDGAFVEESDIYFDRQDSSRKELGSGYFKFTSMYV